VIFQFRGRLLLAAFVRSHKLGLIQKDRNTVFELFIQDSFKASSRLTLSYGVRFEPSFPGTTCSAKQRPFARAIQPGLKVQGLHQCVPGMLFPGDEVFRKTAADLVEQLRSTLRLRLRAVRDGKTSRSRRSRSFLNSAPGFPNDAQVQTSPFSPTSA